jgi:pilus assembly protein CpaE
MAATILVADSDEKSQRRIESTLKGADYQVITASDGASALKLWIQHQPGLILLDVHLPGLDGYQVAERIRQDETEATHLPIIMLTADNDVEQRVRGLRSGADEFLVKPVHAAELLARMKGLLARFTPLETFVARPSLGRIVAFYGAKGGVGTTTVAINTAVALQRGFGRRVCLVDGNLQFGDHRVFLDLGLDRQSITDVVLAPSIEAELIAQVVVRHESGVDLLLAPRVPEDADLVTADHIQAILTTLRGMYDFVVVDLDTRLDDVSLAVMEAAETVFMVMTADLSCLKNVRLVLEMTSRLGFEPEKVQLLLNRADSLTGINVKSAEGALKRKINFQLSNDYRSAISALNSGTPFTTSKPNSSLGKSLTAFARDLDRSLAGAAAPNVLAAAAAR